MRYYIFIISFLFISSFKFGSIRCDEPLCDAGWTAFKDSDCFKIYDKEKLFNFTEAVDICHSLSADLVNIHSLEKQNFLVQFLTSKENNIADAIWMGMKRDKTSFLWNDGSTVGGDFKKWAGGKPTYKTDYDCAQMSLDSSPPGEWVDELCKKKNIVVCQSTTHLKIPYIIERLKETEVIFEYTRQSFDELNLISYFEDVYSDKWSFIKAYNDTDGSRKVLMIPIKENNGVKTWDQAKTICLNYNADLIVIDSWEKQNTVQSFFYQIWKKLGPMQSFWLNAWRDSSGQFRWSSVSGKQITAFNWDTKAQSPEAKDDRIVFSLSKEILGFGRWHNVLKSDTVGHYVVCEFTAHF